jgi:hypothetical protein
MPFAFDVRESSLMQLAIAERRFSVLEFFSDAAYPEHRATKDEVERLVGSYVDALDEPALTSALAHHGGYLRDWAPDRLEEAQTQEELARLCAFAELDQPLAAAESELLLDSLLLPRESDPVFDDHPALCASLTDGLMELLPENIEDRWTATNAAFFLGDDVLFPHPLLAEYRELVGALAELAGAPGLRVYVALHPYRRVSRADLQERLLEDYWDGMKLTPETLDSLDGHDQGRSFHAAVGRSEAEELFRPLLGTWFDWRARNDAASDPVKRLYIREVKPPVGPFGREVSAIFNRELHAERDTSARRFIHLDGKICRYPVASYTPNAQNPRAELPTPERARKLWRVDGTMSDAQWHELVGLFYRGNELIAEHFQAAFGAVPGSDAGD